MLLILNYFSPNKEKPHSPVEFKAHNCEIQKALGAVSFLFYLLGEKNSISMY